MDGYAKMHPVEIEAPAEMLESVAGLDDSGMARETVFAAATLDWSDPASLRWIVCLAARRVSELEAREAAAVPS